MIYPMIPDTSNWIASLGMSRGASRMARVGTICSCSCSEFKRPGRSARIRRLVRKENHHPSTEIPIWRIWRLQSHPNVIQHEIPKWPCSLFDKSGYIGWMGLVTHWVCWRMAGWRDGGWCGAAKWQKVKSDHSQVGIASGLYWTSPFLKVCKNLQPSQSASMKQFRSNYTASARLSAHRGPVRNYK